MISRHQVFFLLAVILIIVWIYLPWFVTSDIIGGDWPYYFPETVTQFPFLPPIISPVHGNGFGGTSASFGIDTYLFIVVGIFVNQLSLPWSLVYKVFFFGMFIFLSAFSAAYLFRTIFPKKSINFASIASLIYTTNTYILMIVGGGQMGIALSYSIAPLVIAGIFKTISFSGSARTIIFSKQTLFLVLIISMQMLFDLRIALLTIVSGFIVFTLVFIVNKNFRKLFIHFSAAFIVPVIFGILVQAPWLIPVIFGLNNPVDSLYNETESFTFFSFAFFSNALALLHPNWPENIFGKTYFFQSEFLIIPIVAFFSLYNINKLKGIVKITLTSLLVISICFSFLAKGAHDPFGFLNIWMFSHAPLFFLFRDPTKFYVPIIISYSVLIPYCLTVQVKNFSKNVSFALLSVVFVVVWLFTIREALTHQIGGTFSYRNVPKEYIYLKDTLHKDSEFYRTLWVPRQQRFAYSTYQHPAVEAMPLVGASSMSDLIRFFKEEKTKKFLESRSIKYVIVPYDVYGEIFIKDRRYDKDQYMFFVDTLQTLEWLEQIDKFEKIAVFKII